MRLFFPLLGMLPVVVFVFGFLAPELVSSPSTWKVLVGLGLVVAFPLGGMFAAYLFSKENSK